MKKLTVALAASTVMIGLSLSAIPAFAADAPADQAASSSSHHAKAHHHHHHHKKSKKSESSAAPK